MKQLKKIDEIIEKLHEIQWIHIDKRALIRMSNTRQSGQFGILDMRVGVQDYFILHLFIDDEKIYFPNFTS